MDEENRLQIRSVITTIAFTCLTVCIVKRLEPGPVIMLLTAGVTSAMFILLIHWEDIFERKHKKGKSFSKEYRKERKRIVEQKKHDEEEKLEKILAYTRSTFIRLEFDENDVLLICCQVEHFVRYGTVDEDNMRTILKKHDVTQASLKNFAWNIGFQYGINRRATTAFVIKLFNQWFCNTEEQSVYRTLKTTSGIHSICADTNII